MAVRTAPIVDASAVNPDVRKEIKRLRGYNMMATLFWFYFATFFSLWPRPKRPDSAIPNVQGIEFEKAVAASRLAFDSYIAAEQRDIFLHGLFTVFGIVLIFAIYMVMEKRILDRALGRKVSIWSCGRLLR